MPELPEVETTIQDLKKIILGRKIKDIWSDFSKIVKKPKSFQPFKKNIIGKKIKNIRRRGKNIIFELSGDKNLLIHQKLTGHLLVGNWKLVNGCWQSQNRGPLQEKINTYIHLMFYLDKGLMLALSDLRKFAKVEAWEAQDFWQSEEIKSLGPEPLEKKFTFLKFKEILKKARGKIKQVLMDQNVIAGIGNIYSDEILFEAGVNPFKEIKRLSAQEIEKIYKAIKKILKKAIKLRGESISDFRGPKGERGFYDKYRKVYRQTNKNCSRCGGIIKRAKISGRSVHFCPKCQK